MGGRCHHNLLLLMSYGRRGSFLLTTSKNTSSVRLYDGAKEAEADTGVGGNSGRSGQGESSQSDGSEQADVERLERHRRNGR